MPCRDFDGEIDSMRLFPVCKVRVHAAGGNPGIAWSIAPLDPVDSLPLMRGGEILYAINDAPEDDLTANLLDLVERVERLSAQFAPLGSNSSPDSRPLLDSAGASALADTVTAMIERLEQIKARIVRKV
jgi:hypothetical protein